MKMTRRLAQSMVGYWAVSDRVMLVKFKGRLINIKLMCYRCMH